MPSYFDKTKSEYWNLEEAIEAEKKGGGVSTESALSSIRSALEFYDNTTAQKWKNSWKVSVALNIM